MLIEFKRSKLVRFFPIFRRRPPLYLFGIFKENMYGIEYRTIVNKCNFVITDVIS